MNIERIFLEVCNMSVTASYIILFVIIARLALKKAPKIYSYSLWSIVLFRLLSNFSFENLFSIFTITGQPTETFRPFPTEFTKLPETTTVIQAPNSTTVVTALERPPFELIYPTIWLIGIAAMVIYSIVSLIKLRRRLVGCTPIEENIYIADHIDSPFVMGLLTPKIYLPSNLSETERAFIITHERTHIKRLDHITRILGFIALALHWFNPLAWIAYVVSAKDMEMSCDETVMKHMDKDIRADYSEALLKFATGKKLIAATPLAFGEGDTKGRVVNVMKYRKPMIWVSIAALAVVLVVVIGFMGGMQDLSGPPTLYAYYDYGVVEMNLGTYSWTHNGVSTEADSVHPAEMDYPTPIAYNENKGARNANIVFSLDNTDKDFDSANIDWNDDYGIVELWRYKDGVEDYRKTFEGGNWIDVSLDDESSYIYVFKIEFADKGDAYYSVQVDNNMPTVTPTSGVTLADLSPSALTESIAEHLDRDVSELYVSPENHSVSVTANFEFNSEPVIVVDSGTNSFKIGENSSAHSLVWLDESEIAARNELEPWERQQDPLYNLEHYFEALRYLPVDEISEFFDTPPDMYSISLGRKGENLDEFEGLYYEKDGMTDNTNYSVHLRVLPQYLSSDDEGLQTYTSDIFKTINVYYSVNSFDPNIIPTLTTIAPMSSHALSELSPLEITEGVAEHFGRDISELYVMAGDLTDISVTPDFEFHSHPEATYKQEWVTFWMTGNTSAYKSHLIADLDKDEFSVMEAVETQTPYQPVYSLYQYLEALKYLPIDEISELFSPTPDKYRIDLIGNDDYAYRSGQIFYNKDGLTESGGFNVQLEVWPSYLNEEGVYQGSRGKGVSVYYTEYEEPLYYEVPPMVMINGKIYILTYERSEITDRDDYYDGEITSLVHENQRPTVNNQSNINYTVGLRYQIIDDSTVELDVGDGWMVFKSEDSGFHTNGETVRTEIQFLTSPLANPDRLPIIDEINEHEPFSFTANFPTGWEFRDTHQGEENIPLGEFYQTSYIYSDDELIGYIGFNTYDIEALYNIDSDEIPAEDYHLYVYPNLRLSQLFQWTSHSDLIDDGISETQKMTINYQNPTTGENFASDGLLTYHKDLEVYVGIAFMPDRMSDMQITELGRTISIAPQAN